MWTRYFGAAGPGTTKAFGISGDGSGVYVVGQTTDTFCGLTSSGQTDAFIQKYGPLGDVLWTHQFGTTENDAAEDIAIGASGAYVVGHTWAPLLGQPHAGLLDVFLVKLALDPNAPPVAEAGANQSGHVGDLVDLDGSGSFDDQTPSESLVYDWGFVSVPVGSAAIITDAGTVSPSFVVDVSGDFVLQLVVTDEGGLSSAPDEVMVSSLNVAPNANAGSDSAVLVFDLVVLDGTASDDSDGDPITYSWTMTGQPAGSAAVLLGASTATPDFIPDLPGTYVMELVVSDGLLDSAPDAVIVIAITGEDFAEQETADALNAVEDLPPTSVTTSGNQCALGQFIQQALDALDAGDLEEARNKLEAAIERTDGCKERGVPDGPGGGGGPPPKQDYITTCADQAVVYPPLKAALDALAP